MNVKDIITLLFCFFTILMLNKFYIKKTNQYCNIMIIILAICINISVDMNYTEYIYNQKTGVYIPLVFFVIIFIFIFTFNFNSFKISLDNLILTLILLHFFISYRNGNINDISKFVDMCILYLSIFFISYIYKAFNYLNCKKIFDFFNYVAIVNGILGFMQFVTEKKLLPGMFNQSIYYGEDVNMVRRVVGFAGTSNAGGNLSAILFSIVLFNYLSQKRRKDLVSLIITSIFSVLTLTRIGYLSIIIQIFIYILLSNWNHVKAIRKKINALIVMVPILITSVLLFGQKAYDILFVKRGNTSQWRTLQFNNVFEYIIPNNTFFHGIGEGQYKYYAYYVLGYSDIDIHSQYINVIVEQGFFMFIIFVIFNLYLLREAIIKSNNMLEKSFIISLFVGNLICSNYNPNQYYLINNIFYYLLIYTFIYQKHYDKSLNIINIR